jgi:hypothetical protein
VSAFLRRQTHFGAHYAQHRSVIYTSVSKVAEVAVQSGFAPGRELRQLPTVDGDTAINPVDPADPRSIYGLAIWAHHIRLDRAEDLREQFFPRIPGMFALWNVKLIVHIGILIPVSLR